MTLAAWAVSPTITTTAVVWTSTQTRVAASTTSHRRCRTLSSMANARAAESVRSPSQDRTEHELIAFLPPSSSFSPLDSASRAR